MPSFRTGTVTRLLDTRLGLQRVEVDGEKSYVLTELIGPVDVGDRVVINTTAVELGLGTGGWHVVHWNLGRQAWQPPSSGHAMKMRYTSLQTNMAAAEEQLADPAALPDLAGMPVVACALHSQVAAVAAAFKHLAPDRRLVYVMTDGGALPMALSDLVVDLRTSGLIDATVTAGGAFGGDYEAVTVASAIQVARELAKADAVVAGIGPGAAGTGTALGHSGLDVTAIVDAAGRLNGYPIVAVRFSTADERDRHRGISHHTTTALGMASTTPLTPEPDATTPDAAGLLAGRGIKVTTMGRGADDDPEFFAYASAAGAAAARCTVAASFSMPNPTPPTPADVAETDQADAPRPDDDVLAPDVSSRRRALRSLIEWVVIIGGALAVAFLVKTFLLQVFFIPSDSMLPVLERQDRIVVNKLSYDLHDINRGDIVVFERPECARGSEEIKDLIKRVVAVSGETVEARRGSIFVNDRRLPEPYLPSGTTTDDFGPQVIPAGHVWLMGDNRDNSRDSRHLCDGPTPINEDLVVGRAFVRIWPFSRLTRF